MALCVVFTSTASAAMMGGVGHGHMVGTDHPTMAAVNSHCEQAFSTHHIEDNTHCAARSHNHSSPSGQENNNSDSTMMLCSVCALCSSVIPTLDVGLPFIGNATQGYVSVATPFLSDFSARLERPPKA